MALDFFIPSKGEVSLVPIWKNVGAPSNGISGTFAGVAQAGDLLVNISTPQLYINTGTSSSPTWSPINHD